MIYPFIVNNPGEAAAAKRRLGAVTIGHLTPPLKSAGHGNDTLELERLIDEYAAADGLDRRRTALLREEILDRAGAPDCSPRAAPTAPRRRRTSSLASTLISVMSRTCRSGMGCTFMAARPIRNAAKSSSPRLHSPTRKYPRTRSPRAFRSGRRRRARSADRRARRQIRGPGSVGHADARSRRRHLTGRNLYAIDPRAVPTPLRARARRGRRPRNCSAATSNGQWHWPRALVMDVCVQRHRAPAARILRWHFLLMGAQPVWDQGSARVSGIEILPIAELDHPRLDITLRISGLFRDAFEAQIALFDEAVRAIASRDEPDDGIRSPLPRAGCKARRCGAPPRASTALRSATTGPASPSALSAAPGTRAPISASTISPPRRPPTARASTVSPTATALPHA